MGLYSLSVVNISVLNQVLGCNLHQSLVLKIKVRDGETEGETFGSLHSSLRFNQSQASSLDTVCHSRVTPVSIPL